MEYAECVMDELTLDGIQRIWLGAQDGFAQTRMFRRGFDASAGQRATIAIYADSVYRLWCNGEHIGRGPAYHHPHRRPIETYDLSPHLRDGENVVAVFVYACGRHTDHSVDTGCPGLVAKLRVGDDIIETDDAWRAAVQTGWATDVPRRTGSIATIELIDANIMPMGWTQPGFDDSGWSTAQVFAPFAPDMDGIYLDTGLPRMLHTFQAATTLALHATSNDVFPLHAELHSQAFGDHLDGETWTAPRRIEHDGHLTLRGFDGEQAAVWVLDLGAEYAGSITFEFDSDSGGVIDVGWSELIEDGRPLIVRKGCSYADRYIARPGYNHMLGYNYSAGRYITVVMRGFTGDVRFQRVGMLASQPDLPWQGAFECCDEKLNAVWQLCERTLHVGVQGEGLIDCPTREQAPYVGDANLIAGWLGRTTADYAYWRYLVRETFASQKKSGQIKTIVFSGITHVLLDYELLAVVGARDYLRATGDRQTIDLVMPAMRRLLQWFEDHLGDDGLPDFAWENRSFVFDYTDDIDAATWNLFIDHPGMGWHNLNEPGIDRSGRNAALSALLAITWDAMAQMTGESDWTRRADAMRDRIRKRFWDQKRQVFADGEMDGRLHDQFSQQTNTWCIQAGCVDDATARRIFARVLDPQDADMARSGPYFWHYMLPAMAQLNMHDVALEHVRRLWFSMIERGATTTFETFAGDEMDSFCHAWACVPVDFLPRHIVGIGTPSGGEVALRPKIDLLSSASATVATPAGPITLGWDDKQVYGSLPGGVTGLLHLPGGAAVEVVNHHRTKLRKELE